MPKKYTSRSVRVLAGEFQPGVTFPAIPELQLMRGDTNAGCVMCGKPLKEHGVIDDYYKILFVCPGNVVVKLDDASMTDLPARGRTIILDKLSFETLFKEEPCT